ncbi:N-6 DNA methylase [Amycolatopsis sp. NPDC058278]|uniref:N-6 DNA methylase n=1 Tax=Amycolatopsis sp. NPDC058278 TaxID=3346417 RepID=UPI0036D8D327
MTCGKHRPSGSALSGPINAEAHALKIAIEVASAWHKNSASGQAEVPMGVVATIAAAGLLVDDPVWLAEEMTSASPTDFVNLARRVWAVVVTRRPDVTLWSYPLLRWLFADLDEPTRQRIKRSALAALNAGQLDLTATERRFDCDLFGPLLGALRSRTATKVNAQMYTPGDIACALTAVALDDLKAGQSFCDDTVGTGGLFRVAAQIVRSRGLDPADMVWFGADTDELAVAATAVNGLLWGLGSGVTLYVGDILAHPHWPEEASRGRAWFLKQVGSLEAARQALDFLKRI